MKFIVSIMIIIFLGLIISVSDVHALTDKEKVFARILYSFNSGDYVGALAKLDKIQSKEYGPLAHYWKGICYGKLQKYDKAVTEYKRALKSGASPKDLYYELGQAYYSMLDYKNATESFKQSVLKRFKVNESFYYIGYIHLSKENFKKSVRFTKRIIDINDAPKELLQAAYFQLGEAYLGNIEKHNKRITEIVRIRVKQYVLPMYDKALKQKSDNILATHIYSRVSAVHKKYGIKKKTFYNGKPYPKKYTKAYVSEKISYDTNVILESSDTDQKATSKSSTIMTTNAYISTKAIHRRRLVFKPEFLFTHSYYFNRDNYQVYQNDTVSFSPALNTSLEHRMKNRPANFNINLQFNHTKRRVDAPSDDSLKKYGNTISVVLDEQLELWAGTSTSFKYIYKQFSPEDDTSSTRENGIYVSHSIFKKSGSSWFLDFGYNVIDASSLTLSSNQIITRATFFKPKAIFSHDLLLGLGMTAKNMKKMKETRGTEVNYGPYVTFSKVYAEHWNTAFSYALTKQTSKSKKLYAYTQSVFAFELKYKF